MAKLIKPDGSITDVNPANGKKFTLKEMQTLIGGFIEVVPVHIPGKIVLADEEGLLKGLALNDAASTIVDVPLVGNVLIMDRKQMG